MVNYVTGLRNDMLDLLLHVAVATQADDALPPARKRRRTAVADDILETVTLCIFVSGEPREVSVLTAWHT